MIKRSFAGMKPGCLLAVALAVCSHALAGTTAFIYQGRLFDGANPATGIYDLRFSLFNSVTGGAAVSVTLTNEDVAVANGLFAVALDFGAAPFDGADRWLAIGVRPGAGSAAFTDLTPRQQIHPTPYALFAANAQAAQVAATANLVSWNSVTGIPPFAPGPGLLLTGSNQFYVDFGGDGVSNQVARSDHNHLTETWTGAAALGLRVVSTSTSGTNFGLWGQSDSAAGRGVFGTATSTSGTNFGVYGVSASSRGSGVMGEATSTNGIGVQARGSGPAGTALALAGGGIRVVGAGISTLTPAFVHRARTTNIFVGTATAIDHPLCNGDSNAVLIITQNYNPSDATGTNGMFNPDAISVFYTGTSPLYAPFSNRWAIYNQGGTFMLPNVSFNVLVIKP